MKNLSLNTYKIIAIVIVSLMIAACKKEAITEPATFTFNGNSTTNYMSATGDTCTLISSSSPENHILWDFGNELTSESARPVISYQKAGTYNIVMTVTSKSGKTASVSKKITVLNRVLKKIVIKSVSWDVVPNQIPNVNYTWPTSDIADIYIQFQQRKVGDMPVNGIFKNSPILFKSDVITGVNAKSSPPIVIDVKGQLIIDSKALDKDLIISLMAVDKSGKTYSLMNSLTSGVNFYRISDKISESTLKSFAFGYGFLFNDIQLYCTYE